MIKNYQVFLKINLSQRILMKCVDREMREKVGATATQLAAVFYLMENNGCQLVDLSRELLQNKSAITTLVERMKKNNLVRKEPSASDKRATKLILTSKGYSLGRRALPFIARYNNELTTDFDAEETRVINRFLDAVISKFKTSPDNYFTGETPLSPTTELNS